MDTEQLKDSISLFYGRLPADAQVYFAGQSWLKTIEKINTEFNLNEDQVKTLSTETTLVLLGIISVSEFESAIRNEMNLPTSLSEQIVSIISRNIISPIRNQLVSTHESNLAFDPSIQFEDGQNLDPQFSSLPIEVQESIALSDYQKKIYALGQKYKLAINLLSGLERVTVSLIKGEISPDDYEQSVAKETNLPDDKIKELIDDVNNEIMKKIRMGVITKLEKVDVVDTNDEVPLPPYVKKEEVILSSNIKEVPEKEIYHGHEIYAESGIEIIDENKEKNITDSIKKDTSILKSSIDMGNRKLVKKDEVVIKANGPSVEIKNKEDSWKYFDPTDNVINKKLGGSTASTNSIFDSSLTKTNTGAPVVHDPYKEEL